MGGGSPINPLAVRATRVGAASSGQDRTYSGPRTHESFLVYGRGTHAWRAALLAGAAVVLYVFHNPWDGANGGTWLGYTLGTIGALLIVWLTLLGLRKRSYRSSLGTVEGWVSAHVYWGIALLLIVTLHSGGELHINIHGAAYVLMCLVIATGLFGVYAYRRYPSLMLKGRGGASRMLLQQEVAALDRRCESVAQKLGDEIFDVMRSAIERTVLGGSWWDLVRGRDRSQVALPARVTKGSPALRSNSDQKAVIGFLTDRLGASGGAAETLWLQELIDLCAKRQSAIGRVRADVRQQTLMAAWLSLHVPLTFALWGALAAHIVSVFVYW